MSTPMSLHATPQEVLDFWFLPPGADGHGQARDVWFRKDAQFDAEIRQRFGATIRLALDGALTGWDDGAPATRLAYILLLDQFTRNAWRDTAAAFAGDAMALRTALALVDAGADRALPAQQRSFVYMPPEHAEDLAMQEQAVALFTALCAAAPGFENSLDYARRHREVIREFGRFPHRNRILGRESTTQELAYLARPGAGF